MAGEKIPRGGGVYEIVNLFDGKRYIGSTVSFRKRFGEHMRKLSRGTHENGRLQNAFNKHGVDRFVIRVLEECAIGTLAREQFWIDTTRSSVRGVGYNISPTAGSPRGYKHDEVARQKMRDAQLNRPPITEETRMRLSESLRGLKRTPEQVERHIKALTGYKHTPEARANMSRSRIGRTNSVEAVAKTAAAHRGMKRSDESRKRMSEAAKARGMTTAQSESLKKARAALAAKYASVTSEQ